MTTRIFLGLAVLIAFSLCYMEWGGGNNTFIAAAAYELFFRQKELANSLLHPIILSGIAGHLLILYNTFIPNKRKWLLIVGTAILSIIPVLVLLSGILSHNLKMIVSVIPFMLLSIINLRYHIQKRKQ